MPIWELGIVRAAQTDKAAPPTSDAEFPSIECPLDFNQNTDQSSIYVIGSATAAVTLNASMATIMDNSVPLLVGSQTTYDTSGLNVEIRNKGLTAPVLIPQDTLITSATTMVRQHAASACRLQLTSICLCSYQLAHPKLSTRLPKPVASTRRRV